jgi:hypothetical protein
MTAAHNRLFRALLFAPLVAGVLVLAVGFAYQVVIVGIPFQDPPPALRAQYERDARMGSAIMSAGEYLLSGGFSLVVAGWAVRRLKRGRANQG